MLRRIGSLLSVAAVAVVIALACFTNHSYITTPSMYPTIPPGSEIFVSPQRAYHVGQVIEFRANGMTWAHRLIAIKPNGDYVTKGDNPQNAPDVFIPALTRKDVIGAVTHAPRWLGFPELIVHHPSYGLAWLRAELGATGKILMVAAIGALCFFAGSSRRPQKAREAWLAQLVRKPLRSDAGRRFATTASTSEDSGDPSA